MKEIGGKKRISYEFSDTKKIAFSKNSTRDSLRSEKTEKIRIQRDFVT